MKNKIEEHSKQLEKSVDKLLIDHGFYPLLAMIYKCLRYIYYDIESIYSNYRFRYLLEENDVFGAVWRPFELC